MWGNMKEFIVGAVYVGIIAITIYLAIEILKGYIL